MNPTEHPLSHDELERAVHLAETVLRHVQSVFLGPKRVPTLLITAALANGHVLLEGVPGVAKTTLAKTFAQAFGCDFRRIQFTPDLLPSDITGTHVLSPKEGSFTFRPGPVFSNIVLGDEINRAPAKTQSALLEAMEEHQVTVEGETMRLPDPFLVLATQNPFEYAGTYPLPEAQIDRFLLRLPLGYPSHDDEVRMLRRFSTVLPAAAPALSIDQFQWLRDCVHRVHVEPPLYEYIVALVGRTRTHPELALGASPRAALALLRAGRAAALVSGRGFVTPDDVKELAVEVLAHRLVPHETMGSSHANDPGGVGERIVRRLLSELPHRS